MQNQKIRGGTITAILTIALVATACGRRPDETAAAEFTGPGKQLFQTKACVGCHNFGGGDSATGPDLLGVVEKRGPDWLKKWLADPTAMLKSDPIAKELAKKFPNPMPNLALTSQEVDDLIEYMAWKSGSGAVAEKFIPLDDKEFVEAKQIFFDRCSGCHGATRWGATGPSLLPATHIVKAKEVAGGGTKSKGTEALASILYNGTPAGMPAWGKEGILDKREMNMMARYIQMTPPTVPTLDMKTARENWELVIPLDKRPESDQSGGRFENYFGVVLRDAGKVAIIDGETKEKVAVLKTGYAVHILRSSQSGRYFYTIGRDGRLVLIDLWYKTPKVVARARTCWDARSVDGSKAPGFEDKYAIIGCYAPSQYAIMDGQTLEPLSIKSVADSRDWSTGNKLPEVRVAAIVASETKPFWVINLKESGWVYLIDYSNPRKPRETRIKANNFLHDGGWIQHPGDKEKRYFMVAANAKNEMCVVDTVKKSVIKPCVPVGRVPHPGRGANFVHPKYGPVFATTYIGEDKITFIGTDPKGHPKHAWKVVENHKIKSAGSLFVKTHPNSKHVWFDMPLSSQEGVNGEVGVFNIETGKISYIKVSDERVVHFEYNQAGNEIWVSGWLEGALYVYDDKTLKLKKKITGDWVKTPTGKFNVYNSRHDIY